MRRFLFENGLSLFFAAIFAVTVVGQSFAGRQAYNAEQQAHGESPVSWLDYVLSPEFGGAVMENWQSEFLQFTLFILATVWLIQRGSPESKEPGKQGGESEEDQKIGPHADERSPRWARVGGLRTWLYSNSLVIVMASIWLASWTGQAIAGRVGYNAEQLDHQEAALTFVQYVGTSDFWNRTLQNWQSEFLAVGSMAVLAIYLRQRGSPESKPVGAPHAATGVEG
jgi:hypothetical protein